MTVVETISIARQEADRYPAFGHLADCSIAGGDRSGAMVGPEFAPAELCIKVWVDRCNTRIRERSVSIVSQAVTMNAIDFPVSALEWTSPSSGREMLYLSAAALFLGVALRYVRRAVIPIQPLLRSLVAVAVVVLAIVAALVLVAAAALSGY